MYRGITAFSAKQKRNGILLIRAWGDLREELLAKTFDEAVDFLTRDCGETFYIVWRLEDFTNALLSLTTKELQDELKDKAKVFYGDTKIFYTGRLLGITAKRQLHGNFVSRVEVNIYQIEHWVDDAPSGIETKAELVAKKGEEILEGLEAMRLFPDSLSSPVAAYTNTLDSDSFPTIYNFRDDWQEAMDYASVLMREEWREAYQIGYWDRAWYYDMRSAYPSIMLELPDTRRCYAEHMTGAPKESFSWGIVKGKVEITALVSPIKSDRDVFTTEEINWLYRRKAGTFAMKDGWFFRWFGTGRPYKKAVFDLQGHRITGDGMVQNLARKMSQGLSGKLDQDNKDGSWGEFYNSILAAMVRSRCRLKVADFIYDNGLADDLIVVQVDGGQFGREVNLPPGDISMGSWRLTDAGPSLVLGPGEVWHQGKRPLGISFDEIMGAIKTHPNKSFYQIEGKYIDLKALGVNSGRVYDSLPRTGGELLANQYKSSPRGS